jgi:HJR/Mrr/RecB family endonuclease
MELDYERAANPVLETRLKAFERQLEMALTELEAITAAEAVQKERATSEQRKRDALLFDAYVLEIERKFLKVGGIVVGEFEKKTKRNPYGKLIEDNTEVASREFLESIDIEPLHKFYSPAGDESRHALMSPQSGRLDFEPIFWDLHFYIAKKVANFRQSSDVSIVNMTPIEFEHHVASELRKYGWKAEVTRASGDQGIDVIATRDSFQVGIQCKFYKGTVPNKAVQEAFAGKSHYELNGAAVVTTGSFTKSALEIANSTGVVACNYHQLSELHERFGLR